MCYHSSTTYIQLSGTRNTSLEQIKLLCESYLVPEAENFLFIRDTLELLLAGSPSAVAYGSLPVVRLLRPPRVPI